MTIFAGTSRSNLAAGTADLILDKLAIEGHSIRTFHVEDVAQGILVAQRGTKCLDDPDLRRRKEDLGLNLGIRSQGGLVCSGADSVLDVCHVVAFLLQATIELVGVVAKILKLTYGGDSPDNLSS